MHPAGVAASSDSGHTPAAPFSVLTQLASRISELQKVGYVIPSEDRGGRYPTWYVLVSEPLSEQSSENGGDWYEHQTGNPRPRATDDLPLFPGVEP